MSTWQSEIMSHGTIVLPVDRARDYVQILGRTCNVQFEDMNEHSLTRPYRKYLQRIEETERILRLLFDEINKLPGATVEAKMIESFLDQSSHLYKFEDVEDSLAKLHKQFQRFRENNTSLLNEKIAAYEAKSVAKVAAQNSAGVGGSGEGSSLIVGRSMGFSCIAGVIVQTDIEKFSRTIYRVTRGNAFTYFEPLLEQADEVTPVAKSVFVIYFQGTTESILYDKVSRIISAFSATSYPWPNSASEASTMIEQYELQIHEKSHALRSYDAYFIQEISSLLERVRPGGNSLIGDWHLFCQMEKATFGTMDMFEGVNETLRCNMWYPAAESEKIRKALRSLSSPDSPGAFLVPDSNTPAQAPTYFRNTGFTTGFQNFVNTYGIPRYRETNPAVITSATLPFLFGIMYGDIGHGSFVLMFGIFLTLSYENLKRSDNELLQMMLGGRYMILLMGIFATYSGFLYNDFFSVGLDIFGSRYELGHVEGNGKAEWTAIEGKSFPYPFGFDPVWKGAENELVFMNSFKMKFSVIIAGLHMGMGIMFKALSAFYFSDYITLFFEFIPQLIFFVCFVGYMDFMIFYKWISPGNAPNLITSLIEMAMAKAPTLTLFPGQYLIQVVLMLIIVCCVPWMLFPKPIILNRIHKSRQKALELARADRMRGDHTNHGEGTVVMNMVTEHVEEESHFDFGECMIHQVIETIEFVLGAISNTASYLRLWALSLAHQQLSLVFFEQTIMNVLNMDSNNIVTQSIFLFIAFAVFAMVTFGIMVGMDGLECFLHALRLQWVEFQSKFFKADGRLFKPFAFQRILANESED